MTQNNTAEDYMNMALGLARDGLGRCAPNPAVGCVIVKDGQIIGKARTADGGRPHAEPEALAQAGAAAEGADVYVTLEPCSHQGVTPPCAALLVQKKVKRVYIGSHDPDPRVNGRGVAMLEAGGVEVIQGLCRAQADAVHAGFFLRVQQGRPFITLKMALSADGKIAGPLGARRQISSPESLAHMHSALRARHDGIAVGAGTALKDDPLLTTRVPGLKHAPFRFVLGGDMAELQSIALFQAQDGGRAVHISSAPIDMILQVMAGQYGMTRVLVEGGATLMQAFLDSGLWDQLYLYRSPMAIGDDGMGAPDFSGLKPEHVEEIGPDRLEIFMNKA